MKIRVKMFMVVLPLIIVPLVLTEISSYFSAVNGVTRLERQLLGFKLGELERFANSQWSLLEENNFTGNSDMVAAAKKAIEQYSRSIILSDTEIIFSIDKNGKIGMESAPVGLLSGETPALLQVLAAENKGCNPP